MILNSENIFLLIIASVWIIGAILQDLKRREVDNIWNFGLIGIVLSYRAFISVDSMDYWYFVNGVIGLILFLVISNLFYYSRLFAGGDAKLLIALGTVLPLTPDWIVNFKIIGFYILAFLSTGAIYALLWSVMLVTRNINRFNKEFNKEFKRYKLFFIICIIISLLWLILVLIFSEFNLMFISIVIILFPMLYIFARSVEESSLVVALNPDKVTEGDWLYEDIIVNGKKIKSSWEGLSKSDLSLIKNHYNKKVIIKQGIPFTPSFLFGLVLLIYAVYKYSFLF